MTPTVMTVDSISLVSLAEGLQDILHAPNVQVNGKLMPILGIVCAKVDITKNLMEIVVNVPANAVSVHHLPIVQNVKKE